MMAQLIERSRQISVGEASLADEPRMPYDEFLVQAHGTHAEWADGRVVLMSPASRDHQDLAGFLAALLRFYAESTDVGFVFVAPFQMKLGPDLPGREPDVLFVAAEHHDRVHTTYLDGAADLAIEIISPESRARDRGEKYYEYEQGEVPEYWLLDPIRKQAEFYVLGRDGIYQLVPVDEQGIFKSTVLKDLWLDVAWLWQQPLPPLFSVLKKWRLI